MINRAMFQVPLAIWTLPMKQPRPSSPARRWAAASALFWRIFLESTWSPFHGSLRSSNTQTTRHGGQHAKMACSVAKE